MGRDRDRNFPRIPALWVLLVVALIGAVGCAGSRAERLNDEGKAALQRGDAAAGAAAFGAAVQLRPSTSKYHYNLGLAYVRLRHLDAAEIEFGEAVRLAPGDLDASRALSLTRARIEVRAQP